jgi:chemotaxis signal transduction protein
MTGEPNLARSAWVTPVPTAPLPFVGIAQLDGELLPIVDLEMPPRPLDGEVHFVVYEHHGARVGVRVPGTEPTDVAALFRRLRR